MTSYNSNDEQTTLTSEFFKPEQIDYHVLAQLMALCPNVSTDVDWSRVKVAKWSIIGNDSGLLFAYGFNMLRIATPKEKALLRKNMVMAAKLKCTPKGVMSSNVPLKHPAEAIRLMGLLVQ